MSTPETDKADIDLKPEAKIPKTSTWFSQLNPKVFTEHFAPILKKSEKNLAKNSTRMKDAFNK
jgi:hypothetical protein